MSRFLNKYFAHLSQLLAQFTENENKHTRKLHVHERPQPNKRKFSLTAKKVEEIKNKQNRYRFTRNQMKWVNQTKSEVMMLGQMSGSYFKDFVKVTNDLSERAYVCNLTSFIRAIVCCFFTSILICCVWFFFAIHWLQRGPKSTTIITKTYTYIHTYTHKQTLKERGINTWTAK